MPPVWDARFTSTPTMSLLASAPSSAIESRTVSVVVPWDALAESTSAAPELFMNVRSPVADETPIRL